MFDKLWTNEPAPRVSTAPRFTAFCAPGQTRVAFAGYWRFVYPGSAIIRRAWPDAIVARAEEGTQLQSQRPGRPEPSLVQTTDSELFPSLCVPPHETRQGLCPWRQSSIVARSPAKTPLYALLESFFDSVKGAWEDLFEGRYDFWRRLLDAVVHRYLDRGLFERGFDRIRCFSCKGRGPCPSCGAKRAAAF